MKKILLVAAVAGLSLASCKKDYTCVCTDTTGVDDPVEFKYSKVKKKDAQKSCDAQNTTYSVVDYSCKLK